MLSEKIPPLLNLSGLRRVPKPDCRFDNFSKVIKSYSNSLSNSYEKSVADAPGSE